MDLKKLFKNNDAVSPVIGVILMVAITVILAAAIGSSVFGQGTTKPAPQTNIDIEAAGITGTTDIDTIASVRVEHLGGDAIHFEKPATGEPATKIMASINGLTSVAIDATGLGTMSVGDVKTLQLNGSVTSITNAFYSTNPTFNHKPVSGDTVNIKIIDVKTNQLIINKDIRL